MDMVNLKRALAWPLPAQLPHPEYGVDPELVALVRTLARPLALQVTSCRSAPSIPPTESAAARGGADEIAA